ncbi:MAG: hypothetical protein AVDCRST_MAG20-2721, partial [uncultured Acidimicrobiales bacterium]
GTAPDRRQQGHRRTCLPDLRRAGRPRCALPHRRVGDGAGDEGARRHEAGPRRPLPDVDEAPGAVRDHQRGRRVRGGQAHRVAPLRRAPLALAARAGGGRHEGDRDVRLVDLEVPRRPRGDAGPRPQPARHGGDARAARGPPEGL